MPPEHWTRPVLLSFFAETQLQILCCLQKTYYNKKSRNFLSRITEWKGMLGSHCKQKPHAKKKKKTYWRYCDYAPFPNTNRTSTNPVIFRTNAGLLLIFCSVSILFISFDIRLKNVRLLFQNARGFAPHKGKRVNRNETGLTRAKSRFGDLHWKKKTWKKRRACMRWTQFCRISAQTAYIRHAVRLYSVPR